MVVLKYFYAQFTQVYPVNFYNLIRYCVSNGVQIGTLIWFFSNGVQIDKLLCFFSNGVQIGTLLWMMIFPVAIDPRFILVSFTLVYQKHK